MHIHWAAEGRAPGDCTDAHQWVLAHCVSCAGCDAQSACGAGGTGLGRKVRATSRLALTSARNVSIVSDVHGSVAGAAACAASCAQDFPDATELIEELFERWDRDGSGELSLEEFREGLQRDGAFLKSRARTSVRDILLEPVAGLLSRTWEGASAHAAALTGAVWDATMQRVACVGDGCRVAWRDGTRLVRSAPTAVGQAILNGEGRFVYNLFSRQLAVFVPNFWDSTKIEADIFLQRSFWLRNLTISPAAASLLTALAPPGLNFTRVFISDAKVSWNNLMALDSSPIVVEIDRISAEASELPADLIRQWLDVCGGVQPDPFTGRYPLLDAATFRVHHVDLTITSPARYGFLSVSLRGLEVKAVNKDGQQQDLLHMLERSQDWENNAITMSRLVECSQASARYLKSGVGLQDGHFSDYLLEPTPLSLLLQQVKNASYMRQIFKQRYTVSVPSGRLLLLGPLAGEQTEDLPDVPADPRLCPFDVPTPEWRIQMASRDQFDWIFSAWTLEAVGEVVGTAKRARPDGKISLNRGISSEKDQQKNKKKEV
eukprot:g6108.t1